MRAPGWRRSTKQCADFIYLGGDGGREEGNESMVR